MGIVVDLGCNVNQVKSFLELSDTPTTYIGQAGKYPKVNDTEDGLIFVDIVEPFEEDIIFKGGDKEQMTTQTNDITLDIASSGHALGGSTLTQWIDGNLVNLLNSNFTIKGDSLDNSKRNSISYIFNGSLSGSNYDKVIAVNQTLSLPDTVLPNLLSIVSESPNLNQFVLTYDKNLLETNVPDLTDFVINGSNTATFTINSIIVDETKVTITTNEDAIDLEVITMSYTKNVDTSKRIIDLSFNEAAEFTGVTVTLITSLVNYITFDNTIADQSGQGAVNTYNGTPITFNAGDKKQGTHSGVFDKTGFIDTDITTTDSYTRCCWIKRDALGTASANALIASTFGLNSYFFMPNNGTVQAGHANFASVSATAPAVGVWGHVCLTYDEPTKHMELYIDGVSQDFSDDQDSAAGGSIGFGNDVGGAVGTRGFYGLMDDARIYNRALSSAEVLDVYNEFA